MKKIIILCLIFGIFAFFTASIDQLLGIADFFATLPIWKQVMHKLVYGIWGVIIFLVIK